MKRLASTLAAACLTTLAIGAAPAQADFGLSDLEVSFTTAEGTEVIQAGTHPFALTVSASANSVPGPEGWPETEGALRDLEVFSPEGLAGNPTAVPRCATLDFLTLDHSTVEAAIPGCADSSALGFITITLGNGTAAPPVEWGPFPLYNLAPSPGSAAKFGFWVEGIAPVTIDAGLDDEPPYKVFASSRNTPQILELFKTVVTLWGNPTDSEHDPERGACILSGSADSCAANVPARPFLTMPRSCTGPLSTVFKALAWWTGEAPNPGPPAFFEGEALSQGMGGCTKLGFNPQITAQPTSRAATSPTGLDFSLDVEDEGLTNPDGTAGADIAKTVVTLPEGMSVNPSQAEGLEVCSEAQLARESSSSAPGEGCPEASKIGSLEVETPLLEDKLLKGSVYVAKPYENRFGSLLAIYIVIKNRELGISVIQPAKVTPDPTTGQLVTVAEDMPQLPFSAFRLHFREGTRSPLVTPPACGSYETKALLYPSSGGAPITSTSSFQVISGPNNGPCPTGGLPPFRPGLIAGTLSNTAGRFSPFNLRLHRSDAEQEFTRFSIKLPPGIAGILAGIPHCPDAAIEAAEHRTGTAELASPSCPAASAIGRSLAGAGVGPSLAYAPGKVYLAGPFEGAPISIAAITAAVVGPFDVGTVVIRQGLKIDPRTAEVFLDPIGSDPIPHIIDGIVVHARDIRAYVDRPNFVFNPTSCARTATASTVHGSGLDFASPADDNPVVVSTPFQAADCAALKFNPRLNLRLIGGTKRGGHPRVRAFLRMKRGESNIAHARVTLPSSAFLDQSHIRTVCTRVQFATDACPAGSAYGYAKAVTPVLDAPIEGPVYLRSSENKLPDLVAALRSREGIEIELVGRVDSVKGRIRNTFDIVPDAPVDTFVLTMQGGNKGLIINSRNLCFKSKRNRAIAEFDAHNGRAKDWRPVVKAKCGKKGKKRQAKRSSHRRARSTALRRLRAVR